MIVCQNEDNPYQFTVILEQDDEARPNEQKQFDMIDISKDAETKLAEVIKAGMMEHLP